MRRKVEECPCCGEYSITVERRRRNTAYENDAMNFVTSCKACHELQEEYWEERWAELYSDQMSGLITGKALFD